MDMTGTRAERQSASCARPERVYGMSSMPGIRFCVANHVNSEVLRVLITVQQLASQKDAEDDLWLRDKFAAVDLE